MTNYDPIISRIIRKMSSSTWIQSGGYQYEQYIYNPLSFWVRWGTTSICEGFLFLSLSYFLFAISHSSPSSSLFRISHCQPPSFLCTDNPCSNPSPAPRLGPHLIHRAAESSPMVFSQEPSLPPRASNNKLAAKLFASSTEQPKVSGTSCLHLFLQRRQPVMIFSKELFPKWVSGQRSFSECK